MIVDTVALGTLASRTAIFLNTVQNGITAAFLMLRIRYFLQMIGKTVLDDGPIIVGIARGDATLTEIANAILEANAAGPNDTTQTLQEDEAWVVFQNTLTPLIMSGNGTFGQPMSEWIKFAPRGLVAREDSGWNMFAFNTGSGTLETGASINGIAQIQGVWLRD